MQTVFNGTSGLNNVSDPAHLPMQEGGIVPLTSCLNVSVGDTGRVSKLAGAAPFKTLTAPHSLTEYSGSLIYAQDSKLYSVNLSGEVKILASFPSNERVYYCEINDGKENVLFWITSAGRGRVIGETVHAWDIGDYLGPETTRKLQEPPNGHICEYNLGRMCIASGKQLFLSEPMNPYLFNLFENRFTFENRITFIAGLENGWWVGTRQNVYWIASDGIQFERKMTTSYGMPEGKPVMIDLNDLPLQINVTGVGYIILTNEGFAVLLPGGYYYNITSKAVTFKDMEVDWAYYSAIKNNQYVYTYADNGIGLCLNLRNFAVTQQDCYSFNSFASSGKNIYGATMTGIQQVSRTPTVANFSFWVNMQRTSRIRFLHLHGEFAGSYTITITNDDEKEIAYIATPRQAGLKQHSFKIPIRRDNGIGTYKKVNIANIDGADFSLDRAEITPISRRLYNAT